MPNWINLGGHYINLDQIVDIITDEDRINWDTYTDKSKPEPCVIFVRPVAENRGEFGGWGSEEIKFFGAQRDAILVWLDTLGCPRLELPANPQRPK